MGAPSYIVADGRKIQHSGTEHTAGELLPFLPGAALLADGAAVLAEPRPPAPVADPDEVVVGLDPNGIRVNRLRAVLAGIDDPAEVRALKALDTRGTAVRHYDRRLRELA
jgi:hypothetical protein